MCSVAEAGKKWLFEYTRRLTLPSDREDQTEQETETTAGIGNESEAHGSSLVTTSSDCTAALLPQDDGISNAVPHSASASADDDVIAALDARTGTGSSGSMDAPERAHDASSTAPVPMEVASTDTCVDIAAQGQPETPMEVASTDTRVDITAQSQPETGSGRVDLKA